MPVTTDGHQVGNLTHFLNDPENLVNPVKLSERIGHRGTWVLIPY